LCRYPWPGNVRELKSTIKLAALICDGVQVLPKDLEIGPVPHSPKPETQNPGESDALAGLRVAVRWAWHSGTAGLWPLLHDLLRRELLQFARAQGLNKSQLADRLGIGRTKLWDLLKELGLNPPEEGSP
jgi:DNA-binding NtrC family response regulator